MKLKNFLIFSALMLSFYEYSSINAVDHSKSLGKRKAVSTSHDNQERCKCGAFLLEHLDNHLEVNGVDGNVMKLKYTTEPLGQIGEGQTNNVYHAHWIGENTTCVALKVYYSLNGYRNELHVLEYLNKIDVSERDHIIKMLGHGKKDGDFFIVLELEGENLKNYFNERVKQARNRRAPLNKEGLLILIIREAARALAQFHKYGSHNDVKYKNFVVSRDQDQNSDVINVKLIDFNNSLINEHQHNLIEENKKEDTRNFGVMVSILSNKFSINSEKDDYSDFNHNSNLDRVINACTQNVSIRPSMNEIAEFLNGDIDQFEYERNADIDHHQHHNIEYFHQYDPHQYEIPQAEHAHPEHHGRSSNVHGEIKRSPRH